jgi:uncharacterized protein (TIGR00730 family)
MLGSMWLASVAVYCASSPGRRPEFSQAAEDLGRTLASSGRRLVYGGGHVGLMGVTADAALAAGGDVLGVITTALQAKEVAHTGLPQLVVVDTMHERKAAIADAADGFIMLPGGYGTFDEFFEMLTWTQLGIHDKPCGILNVGDFFAPLLRQMDEATDDGFIRAEHRDLLIVDTDADRLIERLDAWTPVRIDKWMDRTDR